MARIHYFQQYSQRENVRTNNALLFLGRLYEIRPSLFEMTLNNLLEDKLQDPITVGIEMEQQRSTGEGAVPDGFITQRSFKLVVETKNHKGFDIQQLRRHLTAFDQDKEETKVLLLLAPDELNVTEFKTIEDGVQIPEGVVLASTTYASLITAARNANERNEHIIDDLIADFEVYCNREGLISTSKYWMRAITSSLTIEHNRSHRIYYDLASRGYSDHAYLGLYAWKAVRSIGKIENIITADIKDGQVLVKSLDMGKPMSPEQERLIREVVGIAKENNGWDIREGHRFFIVEEFHETEFKKESKHALMRTRFFDLREYLSIGAKALPDTQTIAEQLRGKEWERDRKELVRVV